MKIKIFAFLLLVFVIILSSLSCGDGLDCGPFPDFFKLTNLESELFEVEYSEDRSKIIDYNRITENQVVYDKFAIGIISEIDTYGWNDPIQNFGLISTAYACTPPIPASEEQIDSIIITANKDFNSDYPQGTDLSEIFDIVVYDEANNFNNVRFDLNEYIGMDPVVPYQSYLILKEKPDTIKSFQFNIQFYQQGIDVDYFEFMTEEVIVE